MMPVISYTRPDGGVSFIRPLISRDDPPGFGEADALERATRDVPPNATNVSVHDPGLLPSRRFRNAWRKSKDGVIVHVAMARAIRLGEIRERRNALLAASDVAALKAQDTGSGQPALAAYRNALRDLPVTVQPELDAITDVEALAAYEPAWPTKP